MDQNFQKSGKLQYLEKVKFLESTCQNMFGYEKLRLI